MNRIAATFIRALIACTYGRMPLKLETRRALNTAFDRWMPGLYRRLLLYCMTVETDFASVTPYPVQSRESSLPIIKCDLSGIVSDRPLVSIVIPVYGKSDYTSRCLASIQMLGSSAAFEVIVVDDNSPDDTESVLRKVSGIRIVSNQVNLGFVRSCNIGAGVAKGEFLVFLNNDTVVLEGWLDALIDTFVTHPTAGLVGSKLLYDNGAIQEAGGIIWSDGTGWNYGRHDKPGRPEFNYVREVDYCSGASIAIRKNLFEQVGGFDERYIPAYYEDTDIAFTLRKAGYRVLYQPASQVIHYEGITCGKDMDAGVKSYQSTNRVKFLEKWSSTLVRHPGPIDMPSFLERDHYVKGRILIIDATTPTPDQDSGSVDAFYYQKILVELGYKVVFAPENLVMHDDYTRALLQLGVECLYAPYVTTLQMFLEKHGREFDFVLLCRAWTAYNHFKDIKRYCPQAKVIFDTVDLHHLREEREAMLTGSTEIAEQARKTKKVEFELMRSADITIVLSEAEAKLLHEQEGELRIATIPLILEIPGKAAPFDERKDVVFLGGFQHPPNVDAVEYFVKETRRLLKCVLPLLTRKRLSNRSFRISTRTLSAIPSLPFAHLLDSLLVPVAIAIVRGIQIRRILPSIDLSSSCHVVLRPSRR